MATSPLLTPPTSVLDDDVNYEALDLSAEIKTAGLPAINASSMASTSAWLKGEAIDENFRLIKDDLLSNGVSQEVDGVRQEVFDTREAEDSAKFNDIISSDMTPDQKIQEIDLLDETVASGRNLSTDDYIKYKLATTETVNDSLEAVNQSSLIQLARKEMEINELIDRAINKQAAELDPSTLVALGGLVAQAAPGFAWELKNAFAAADPEASEWWMNVLPGQAMKAFETRYHAADPDTRLNMVKAFLAAVDAKGAMWLDTDMGEYDALQALQAAIDPHSPNKGIMRSLYNIVGIADATLVGGPLGKLLLRGTRPLLRVNQGSLLAKLSIFSPNKGAEQATKALMDTTGARAETLGTTRTAVANTHVFPPASNESIPSAPSIEGALDITDPNFVAARNLLDDAGVANTSFRFSDEEIAAVEDTVQKATAAAAERAGVQVLNKTQVTRLSNGVIVDSAISMTAKRGWPSYTEAQEAAKAWADLHPQAIFEFFRKSNKGEYVPIQKSGTQEGLSQVDPTDLGPNPLLGAELPPQYANDYIFRVKEMAEFTSKHATSTKSLERPKRVLPGWWSKWANVASQFSKEYVNKGYVATVKANALKKRMFDLQADFRGGLIGGLSVEDKQAVVALVRQEDDLGKQFSKTEVELRLGNNKQVAAYNAIRQTNYIDYIIKNNAQRARHLADGAVRLSSNIIDTLVVPIGKDAAAKVKYAVDAETGKVVTLSKLSIDDLYSKGHQIVNLGEEGMHVGSKHGHVTHALVKTGGEAKLSELPTYVLRYLPGHITKNYNATHAVEMRYFKVVNGEKVEATKVLSMATGSKQAEEASAELISKMKGDKNLISIKPRLLREYQEHGYVERHGEGYYRANGQYWFSKGRGNEIEHASGNRELTPVDEIMLRARASAGRLAFLQPSIEDNVNRYNIKYRDMFGEFNPYIPPKPIQGNVEFKDGVRIDLKKEHSDALAYWHRFRLNMGMDTTFETDVQRKAMMWIGDKLIGSGKPGLGRDLGLEAIKLRDRGLTGSLSAAAFASGIALSPIRQLLLQVQSSTVYSAIEHALPYMSSGKAFKEAEAVLQGMAFKYSKDQSMWLRQRPKLAKKLNVSEKEVDSIVDTFKEISSVIDSNHFLDQVAVDSLTVVGESAIFRNMEHIFNAGKAITYFGRKYGFSAGEMVNKLSAFLAVRNKHIVNNPGKKWEDMVVDIVGETEARTGGMNDMGRTALQTGIWRPLFQFSNYNARALQQLIPDVPVIGALSDKSWSNAERRRLAVIQFAIYGISGYGLMETYDSVKEKFRIEDDKDAIIRPLMEEGFAGMAMDFIFRSLDAKGEETDLDFSSSFAPYSGALPISKGGRTSPYFGFASSILESVGLMEPDTRSFVSDAPGFSLLKRASRAASVAMTLSGTIPDEDFTTLDKWKVLARIGLSVSPQYKNYLAGRLMMKEGLVRDARGRPIVTTTGGEAWARALFGVKSEKERDYYSTKQEIMERYSSFAALTDKELKETASTLHQNLMKISVLAAKDRVRPELYETQLLEHMRYLKETLDPYEYETVMKYFKDNKFSELTDSGEAKLNSLAVQILGDEDPDSEFATKIMNLPENWEQKKELENIINTNRAEKEEALRQGQ